MCVYVCVFQRTIMNETNEKILSKEIENMKKNQEEILELKIQELKF